MISSTRIVRVHQQRDHSGLGNQLGKQLEPLRIQLGGEHAHARDVATRPRETGDEAQPDRVGADDERDWNGGRRPFGRLGCRGAAARRNQLDLAADKFGGHSRQPVIVAVGPAVLDGHVLPLDISRFAQSLVERGHERGGPFW